MHILISILMILGACLVVLIGLLSVLHDLLIRTPLHLPSEFERREAPGEESTVHATISEDFQ